MKSIITFQADLNQAINMVSYYASSSEPAQVRGKTVYIQYSNRHEIVNNKSPGDVPGNVLLVTIEGVEAGDVSIDVIHLVSAFNPQLLHIGPVLYIIYIAKTVSKPSWSMSREAWIAGLFYKSWDSG